ncbi:MAG: hypothetical protein AAFR61_19730 [Bacteroidota bacterium]
MPAKKKGKGPSLTSLKKFLKNNEVQLIRTSDLRDPAANPDFKWTGVKKSDQNLIKQLRAYQRLLNVVPSTNTDLILPFLQEGLRSAVHIAAISQQQFLQKYQHLTKDQSVLLACHRKATAIRARLLLHYVNRKQQPLSRIS